VLFSSLEFLLLFLPLAWLASAAALRFSERAGIAAMLAASLVFYGYWNARDLLVLVPLALLTYVGARRFQRNGHALLPAVIVALNLATLGYFKYAGFVADTLRAFADGVPQFVAPALPLGISFFVFQKVAFIVDVKRGLARVERDWLRFLLFVSFFPQLIAGPIVHWREIAPQLNRATLLAQRDAVLGLTLFSIGLAKKTLLADLLSPYVGRIFGADAGTLHAADAWCGVLAYTLQIYFDFSGYSDMAVGLGLLFGVRLPWNFLSPYQAGSIVEFWRRWHITLSQFLRDYLYIPLGGNRNGAPGRYRNIMIVMLLGGLWHGAGWNFVLWGGLHGAMIVSQHAWSAAGGRMPPWVARPLTFLCVLLAWVPFRAESGEHAAALYGAMLMPDAAAGPALPGAGVLLLITAGLLIAWLGPNTRRIAETARRAPELALVSGVLAGAALLKQLYAGEIHEFIYFRF